MPTVNENHKDIQLGDFLDDDLDFEHRGKVRKVVLENGNHLWIECVDPYGHWKVKLGKGRLPDYIANNSYTQFRDALIDVNRWLREKKHAIVYTTAKAPITQEE